MNKTEKLLNTYYLAIEEIAKKFYRKYFFDEYKKNGEAKEYQFNFFYEDEVFRISAYGRGSGEHSGDNTTFDFCSGTYYFSVSDMYVALKNNIPKDILFDWYEGTTEAAMNDSFFYNLYTFYKQEIGKKQQ